MESRCTTSGRGGVAVAAIPTNLLRAEGLVKRPRLDAMLFLAIGCSVAPAAIGRAHETLCRTDTAVAQQAFDIYTGWDDVNNPIVWTHAVPHGLLRTAVNAVLSVDAYDVDYPASTEHNRLYINGHDLGLLEGTDGQWGTVDINFPPQFLVEGVNQIRLGVDELRIGWKLTVHRSELRVYCRQHEPDFMIAVLPESRSVVQGGETSYTIETEAEPGFSSRVALTATGLPSGARGRFNVDFPYPGADSTYEVTTDATTPPGTYELEFSGRGGGWEHSTTALLMVTPAPDFELALTPSSQRVFAGGAVSYTADVTALYGMSAGVDLSVSGLPKGCQARFSTDPIVPSGQSALILEAGPAVALGTYTLTVTAQGGGRTHSGVVTLVVVEKPDFTIVVRPAIRTVGAGGKTELAVVVTPQHGFDEAVDLEVDGLPMGAEAVFVPRRLRAPATSTLKITAPERALGTYALSVIGVSEGLSRRADATLEITAPPCPTTTLMIAATPDEGSVPLTVAFASELNEAAPYSGAYRYVWHFGDGESSTAARPSHIYAKPGSYPVKLIATNDCDTRLEAETSIRAEAFRGWISTSFDSEHARVGDEVMLTIVFLNEAAMPFDGIRVSIDLPPELVLLEDSAPVKPSSKKGRVTWELSRVEKKEKIRFELRLRVSGKADPGKIACRAYLEHRSLDDALASDASVLQIGRAK